MTVSWELNRGRFNHINNKYIINRLSCTFVYNMHTTLNFFIMKAFILFFAVFFLLGVSCKNNETPTPGEIMQVPLTQTQKQLISSNNAFGFEFFKTIQQFADTTRNLMVSPLSVSMALGMTRNGAAGGTLDSMTRTLGFTGLTGNEINESCQFILKTFTTLDPKVELSIANSIWYKNTFPVEQEFILTNQNYFEASVTPLDFTDPESVTTINKWVSDKTNNLIPKIIESIPENMVMYLINAVYFKGIWKYQFDKNKTAPRTFYLADGTTVQAPAMMLQGDILYYKGLDFSAVDLPYNQGNFTMTVLLPDSGYSPGNLVNRLSQENWILWSGNFIKTDVVLQLPKFKYEYDEKKMVPVLTKMGMGVAFDPENADFTRINVNGELFISEVRHKTYIETNEEGTEAAAVTSVGITTTSAGPGNTVYFYVNRPFVYFISEKSTGTLLFIGTVMNPLAE